MNKMGFLLPQAILELHSLLFVRWIPFFSEVLFVGALTVYYKPFMAQFNIREILRS
jgi:hypothetical protein